MNNVIDQYNNTGVTRYPITFEYDRESQVSVRTFDETTNEYIPVTDWEFDGNTAIQFTGAVPDTFQIVRTTDISQSYGPSKYSVFVQGSAIKASELNGNLELLRLAIEESGGLIDNLEQDLTDLNNKLDQEIIDRENGDQALQDQIDQEIIDRTNGDLNLQNQIDSIENNINQIESGSLDSRYVEVGGDTMTGVLSMSSQQIKQVQDPTDDGDAVNLRTLKEYLGISDGNEQFFSFDRESFTAIQSQSEVVSTLDLIGRDFIYLNGKLLNRNVDYLVAADNHTVTFSDVLMEDDFISIVNFTPNSFISRETIPVTSIENNFVTSLVAGFGNLNITVNGVHLLPGDRDYGMITDNRWLFTHPLQINDVLHVYQCDFRRNIFLGALGQTEFEISSINSFTPGTELVLLNGCLLEPTTHYTTDGTVTTLTTGCNVSDYVAILTPF